MPETGTKGEGLRKWQPEVEMAILGWEASKVLAIPGTPHGSGGIRGRKERSVSGKGLVSGALDSWGTLSAGNESRKGGIVLEPGVKATAFDFHQRFRPFEFEVPQWNPS